MLVLSRKVGEKLVIGDDIIVTVVAVSGDRVKVGIDAPDDVGILRAELAGCQDDVLDGDQAVEPVSSELSDCHGDEIVQLATARTPQGAHLRRQTLEDKGIHCEMVDEYVGDFGVIPPGHSVPELWVCREDAERAQAVMDDLQKPHPR